MAKAIPLLATFGLICLMVLPAPGILGLLIGLGCAIVIVLCAAIWLFDRAATRLAFLLERSGARLFTRRQAVHAGSGMMRKAKVPKAKAS
ncbi:hypothetical protein ASF49_05455 [Methylobacterium sp. Leaf104]|uniref:hypothetical protein n=1 Tax=Methylobacterium TaxID=407 RepID=UPI0006F499FF|nr:MULTISPECIES: hypothetical protein [Methylobacterium]KQP38444.1 hypothetical protein ASF49_05455 [Methylobacterium sp. Leaf104]MCI9880143.1 hypothetical protein [Methylobacterium goesingense]